MAPPLPAPRHRQPPRGEAPLPPPLPGSLPAHGAGAFLQAILSPANVCATLREAAREEARAGLAFAAGGGGRGGESATSSTTLLKQAAGAFAAARFRSLLQERRERSALPCGGTLPRRVLDMSARRCPGRCSRCLRRPRRGSPRLLVATVASDASSVLHLGQGVALLAPERLATAPARRRRLERRAARGGGGGGASSSADASDLTLPMRQV